MMAKEGLHPEGNPGDAEFLVEVCGSSGEGGGVRFEGDFFDAREVKGVAESVEELAEMGGGKHRGSASAKVDGL